MDQLDVNENAENRQVSSNHIGNQGEISSKNEQVNDTIDIQQTRSRPNKTEKKYLRYKKKLEKYKQKKEENKRLKQLNRENGVEVEISEDKPKSNILYETFYNKRELKKIANQRLESVYNDSSNSLKICIDCSFSHKMSDKELSRLAQQIGRCYATNKSIKSPVHLTLCNLDKESKFYAELKRVNDGFVNYKLITVDKPIETHYSESMNSLAYLSPDSTTYLESLDSNTTYVIGGLVDETVAKKVTLTKCTQLKLQTYALPIEKYMQRKVELGKTFNYNKILSINQVFDILANFYMLKDWPKALECGLPRRKGFVPIDATTNNNRQEDNNENCDSDSS